MSFINKFIAILLVALSANATPVNYCLKSHELFLFDCPKETQTSEGSVCQNKQLTQVDSCDKNECGNIGSDVTPCNKLLLLGNTMQECLRISTEKTVRSVDSQFIYEVPPSLPIPSLGESILTSHIDQTYDTHLTPLYILYKSFAC